MSIPKERRAELLDEISSIESWGMTFCELECDELRALLDLANERDRYRALLSDAREAIASLPEGALGYSGDDNAWWPIRDELLHNIDAALEGKND